MKFKRFNRNARSAIYGVASVLAIAVAAPQVTAQERAPAEVELNIPAQRLADALVALAQQTGTQILAPDSVVGERQAPTLAGVYTVDEALAVLLSASGLVANRSSSGAFIIAQQVSAPQADLSGPGQVDMDEPEVEDIITVFGRAPGDTTDNIPQRVAVFDEISFEIGLSDSVGDVLRLAPTASRDGSSQDMFADDYLLRGFNAEQSTNGLGFTRTDHPRDLANVERIEVLKGPASVLYGQMEPGGTINVVTKQPLSHFFAETRFEYGSYDRLRGSLDITGPLSENVAVRLNVAYQENDSHIDFLEHQRFFIAPNISVDLSQDTNLTIEGSYAANEWTALNGGTPIEGAILDNPNGPYDESFNPAFSDGVTQRDSWTVNARLTHHFTDRLKARASYTYIRNEADWTEYAPFGLAGDFRTLDRIIFAGRDTFKNDHQAIVDLSGEIVTGPLTHRFVAGIDYREGDLTRPTQVFFISPIDIFEPEYAPLDLNAAVQVRDRNLLQDDRSFAVFLQDRVSIMERLHVLAGVRYITSEQSQQSIDNFAGSSSLDEISQTDWTTQFGIVYDVTQSASVYASRSEAFVPQQGTTSGARPLESEESTQYEAGFRVDFGDLRLNATGFVITKDNIAIEDPFDSDFEVAEGEARSKGAEISISGYVNPEWYVSAAYGYTDTEILRSDDPDLEGNAFINVPEHTVSLQTRYEIGAIPGLSVGGTLVYVGERQGDDENSFVLPDFVRADLVATYGVTESVQVDLLVDNVFDEEYYSPASFDGVIREPGRAVRARLKLTH